MRSKHEVEYCDVRCGCCVGARKCYYYRAHGPCCVARVVWGTIYRQRTVVPAVCMTVDRRRDRGRVPTGGRIEPANERQIGGTPATLQEEQRLHRPLLCGQSNLLPAKAGAQEGDQRAYHGRIRGHLPSFTLFLAPDTAPPQQQRAANLAKGSGRLQSQVLLLSVLHAIGSVHFAPVFIFVGRLVRHSVGNLIVRFIMEPPRFQTAERCNDGD